MAASAFFRRRNTLVFSTIIFLFRFLPITLALYYLAPAKLKNTVLFVCSLVFYCWGEVRFFPVMLALILINYLCGRGLERFEQNKTARLILLLIALAGKIPARLPRAFRVMWMLSRRCSLPASSAWQRMPAASSRFWQ